jgi:hypothetical protein
VVDAPARGESFNSACADDDFCGQVMETKLVRAKTQDLADNRRMFELFTKCKDHSMHKGDHEVSIFLNLPAHAD